MSGHCEAEQRWTAVQRRGPPGDGRGWREFATTCQQRAAYEEGSDGARPTMHRRRWPHLRARERRPQVPGEPLEPAGWRPHPLGRPAVGHAVAGQAHPAGRVWGDEPAEEVATWLRTDGRARHGARRALPHRRRQRLPQLRELEFAFAVARASNTCSPREYTSVSPRVQTVGVLPLHDPAAAAEELRRAVTELGLISFEMLDAGPAARAGRPASTIRSGPRRSGWACRSASTAPQPAPTRSAATAWRTFGEVHCYAFTAGMLLHFTSVICNGVPLRFPKLQAGLPGDRRHLAAVLPGSPGRALGEARRATRRRT